MRRANIADSKLWAYRVEIVVQLAYRRRDDRDRPAGTPGAASPAWAGTSPLPESLSEFFPDEVAMVMNVSRGEATTLTAVAWTLTHLLPDTWGALADGELSWSRARAIAQEIGRYGPELDPHVVRTVEAVVLPQAAELPVARLRSLVRTAVVRYDAEAAGRRRRAAEAAADVFLRRSALDGMAEVVTVVPRPVAAAMVRTVDAHAHARQAKADGDPPADRTDPRRGVGRDDVASVGRRPPGRHRRAPRARAVEQPAARPGRPRDPWPTGGRRGGRRGAGHRRAPAGPAHRPRRRLPRRPSGSDRRLPASGSARRRRGLARHPHPPGTRTGGAPRLPAAPRRGVPVSAGAAAADHGYAPTAAQRRWGRARDHGCRHPGCRNRVGWVDLDHVVPHAEGGATDCDNLCCLCRLHHRLKTHASGWSFHLDADGALLVTTPSGVTRISRPPGSYLLEPFELSAPLPDAVVFDVAPF
jgi:hypothetical protein